MAHENEYLDYTGLQTVANEIKARPKIWKGSLEDWEELPLEEKAKYDYVATDEEDDPITAATVPYDNTESGLVSTNVQGAIDEVAKSSKTQNPNHKVVICIGDSYNKNTEWWDGWGKCLHDNYPSFEVYSYEAGGGGFVANTDEYNFLGALQNHSQDVEVQDKASVTDIVVLGGYNDVSVSATDEQMRTAIGQFVAYCNSTYPNAKVTIAGIAVDYNSAVTQGKLNSMNMEYSTFAVEKGATTHPNFKYLLQCKSRLFFSDGNPNSGFHPSTTGNTEIANALAQYLTSGNFEFRTGYVVGSAYVYRHNDKVLIMDTPITNEKPNGATKFSSLFTQSLPFNTWVDLGSLEVGNENLLWGATPQNSAIWTAYAMASDGTGTSFISTIVCRIQDKHLFANNTGNVNAFNPSTNFISMPGTLAFDWQEII